MDSGFKVKIFTEKLLALDPFGPWSNFLTLVIVLLRETLNILLVSALIAREFLFEISSLCSV
jgi:hypothetical protein